MIIDKILALAYSLALLYLSLTSYLSDQILLILLGIAIIIMFLWKISDKLEEKKQ